MATSAWLHVPTNMRLTECLESVLKEQRPHCLPALLANYREHGVVPTQVNRLGLMSKLVPSLWNGMLKLSVTGEREAGTSDGRITLMLNVLIVALTSPFLRKYIFIFLVFAYCSRCQ